MQVLNVSNVFFRNLNTNLLTKGDHKKVNNLNDLGSKIVVCQSCTRRS